VCCTIASMGGGVGRGGLASALCSALPGLHATLLAPWEANRQQQGGVLCLASTLVALWGGPLNYPAEMGTAVMQSGCRCLVSSQRIGFGLVGGGQHKVGYLVARHTRWDARALAAASTC
jgi:hypothetical protein